MTHWAFQSASQRASAIRDRRGAARELLDRPSARKTIISGAERAYFSQLFWAGTPPPGFDDD